jgi:hypothetical protein
MDVCSTHKTADNGPKRRERPNQRAKCCHRQHPLPRAKNAPGEPESAKKRDYITAALAAAQPVAGRAIPHLAFIQLAAVSGLL